MAIERKTRYPSEPPPSDFLMITARYKDAAINCLTNYRFAERARREAEILAPFQDTRRSWGLQPPGQHFSPNRQGIKVAVLDRDGFQPPISVGVPSQPDLQRVPSHTCTATERTVSERLRPQRPRACPALRIAFGSRFSSGRFSTTSSPGHKLQLAT